VTLAQLRQIIKDNGFVSKDVSAVALGTPSTDQKTFTVAGTNEQLSISEPPRKRGEDWELKIRTPETP
jgi:hypothetical protein